MEIETLSKLSAILASCIGWVTLELWGFSTDPRLTVNWLLNIAVILSCFIFFIC